MKNSPFKITVFAITVAVSILFVSSCSKSGNDISDDSIRDQQETSDVSEYTADNSEVELPKIPFDSTSTTGEISQPETTVPPETTSVTAETTVPAETIAVTEEATIPPETTAVPEETTVPAETTPVPEETTVPTETTTVNSEVYLPKIPF